MQIIGIQRAAAGLGSPFGAVPVPEDRPGRAGARAPKRWLGARIGASALPVLAALLVGAGHVCCLGLSPSHAAMVDATQICRGHGTT